MNIVLVLLRTRQAFLAGAKKYHQGRARKTLRKLAPINAIIPGYPLPTKAKSMIQYPSNFPITTAILSTSMLDMMYSVAMLFTVD